MKSVLVLEDGTYFSGEAFGKPGETVAEVIFNTSMTGYQEIITDPSYRGKIVVMTYPLIGNCGFNHYDNQSDSSQIQGLVVKELSDAPSNWRLEITPNEYFSKNNIVGIKGIDTRTLAQHIRDCGIMYGIISTESGNTDILLERLAKKKQEKRNLVAEVTTKAPVRRLGSSRRIVVLDFGVKNSVIKSLEKDGCDIFILPAASTASEVMGYNPGGILLSNGPGNPADLPFVKSTVQELINAKVPIMGIGLGHQLIGLALGGRVTKLKSGHHGNNYPVKDHNTGRCYITSQYHSYVLQNNFNGDVIVSQTNINDNTVEGLRHKKFPLISVQYHPQAITQDDTSHIFYDFYEMIDGFKS